MTEIICPTGGSRSGRDRGAGQSGRVRTVDLTVIPLATVNWAIGVNLLAHARQKCTSEPRRPRFGHTLGPIVDLERDFVELRDRVTAYFSRRAIMICNAFCALLKAPTNNGGLVIDLADDQDRADYSRRQAL